MDQVDEVNCQRLEDNDEGLSTLMIGMMNQIKASRYGEALSANTAVKDLRIQVGENLLNSNDVVDLLSFIERSPNLEKTSLYDINESTVAAFFLLAISKNSSIKHLRLHGISISEFSMKTLLSQNLDELTLSYSELSYSHEFSDEERGLVSSISKIVLIKAADSLIDYVFRRQYDNLQELIFGSDLTLRNQMGVATSKRLQCFLESNSVPPQNLGFGYFKFSCESFEPICTGLCKHLGDCDVSFLQCEFDSEATSLFLRLCRNATSPLRYIKFSHGVDFFRPFQSILHEVLVSKPNLSKLEVLDLSCLNRVVKDKIDLEVVLAPLENQTALEYLDFGLVSRNHVEELSVTIPKLRGLKRLSLKFPDDDDDNELKKKITSATKKNLSLTNLQLSDDENDESDGMLDADLAIGLYCFRNQSMQNLLNNQQHATSSVWPSILSFTLDYQYWHEIIFQSLMKLSENLGEVKVLKRKSSQI